MRIAPSLVLLSVVLAAAQPAPAAEPSPPSADAWKVGTPIVTYWAGPPMTDAVARQMAEGGWNLVWCTEKELDVAQRHGLRAQLRDGLLRRRRWTTRRGGRNSTP